MMKPRFFSVLLLLAVVRGVSGATLPLYVNNGVTNNAGVDAAAFYNAGTFNISNAFFFGSGFSLNSTPYSTLNTLNYTNSPSGVMNGLPGFRFDTVTNSVRLPANNFINNGTINASGYGSSLFFFVGQAGLNTVASGGSVQVNATNITSPGVINVGSDGVIRLQGKNVNLNRATLLASGTNSSNPGFFSFLNGGSVYFNPSGVQDLYWGAGTNQVMSSNFFPNPLNLIFNNFSFATPNAQSPYHEVQIAGRTTFQGSFLSGITTVPALNGTAFSAYVYTNATSATNRITTVVFLATNVTETNITATVRFADEITAVVPVVEFASPDLDFISGLTTTNTLYFVDRLETLTNSILATNLVSTTYRPEAYELARAMPFEFFIGAPSNNLLSNVRFFQPGFSNRVATNFYAAYSALIGNATTNVVPNPINPSLTDPSNFVGRVEIIADNLDLSRARIRAENFMLVKSTNFITASNAVMDSPIFNYSLANTTSTLNLSNAIPTNVKRLNGTISAWSGTWTNQVGNVETRYHVLVLDASQFRSLQSVTLPQFYVKGTNVIFNNTLIPGQSFVVDSPSITFDFTNQLLLAASSLVNFSSNLFPTLNYFTNNGLITITGEGRFGSDQPQPYSNMVNRGTIIASTLAIRAREFENTGTLTSQFGPASLNALRAFLGGGQITAPGDITLSGQDYKIKNQALSTASSLNLVVTNSLTDTGAGASNVWTVGYGFNLLVKPALGDLLGTTITSAVINAAVTHVWAAEDRGASRVGYSNNVALGHLVLSSSNLNSLFTFTGASSNNALYVDYLEFAGVVLSNYASMLEINTNLTLYFATANVPVETLDGQFGGRLRWVKNFAGPNSSADVILPSGQTISVNINLLNSTSIDSDADGIVNKFDLSPFDGVVLTSVRYLNGPPRSAEISWNAASETVYRVEYATKFVPADWQLLLNYTNSVVATVPVTLRDVLPTNAPARYYRVLYFP